MPISGLTGDGPMTVACARPRLMNELTPTINKLTTC